MTDSITREHFKILNRTQARSELSRILNSTVNEELKHANKLTKTLTSKVKDTLLPSGKAEVR